MASARKDEEALQAIAAGEGGNFKIAPWDWRYLAEKRRKAEFDFDEGELKPYLQLDRMIEAAFYAATRLFGLKFAERFDLKLYHPDVRAWEVTGRDGAPKALFLGDYFARPSKRSGAWMSGFRGQQKLDGRQLPIVVNVMNFAEGAQGEASLLSPADARTLFHEFGHALHGMLSDVTYPRISGTHVAGDFVEFPSQIFEHWIQAPEMLRRFALHYKTGEPMPEALVDKLLAARRFNQGWATVEYTASALVDMKLHLDPSPGEVDVVAFERQELERIGMPDAIAMRHRAPHFQHIFSGGYSAAYYSYLWSEVLDADGFEAFEESGDIFDPEVARRLEDFVYAAGGSRDYDEAYRAFRGRAPSPGPYSASGGSKSGCWLSHGLSANLHRHRRRSGRRWLRQRPMLCRVHGLDDLDRRTRRSSRSNSPPGLTPGRVRRDSFIQAGAPRRRQRPIPCLFRTPRCTCCAARSPRENRRCPPNSPGRRERS